MKSSTAKPLSLAKNCSEIRESARKTTGPATYKWKIKQVLFNFPISILITVVGLSPTVCF